MDPLDRHTSPGAESLPAPRAALVAFTLFASYCLAANVAIALHECGHALGCWIAGGKMLGLVLGPQGYSGSYADRDIAAGFQVSRGYLIHVASGVVFGAAFGAIFLGVSRFLRRGSLAWIICYASGTWAIGNNGAYLLLGSLHPFDDALFLMEEGVPRWLLFIAGLFLVATFLALFASFLQGIGLRKKDSYLRWLLTIEGGLMAYPRLDRRVAAAVAPNWQTRSSGRWTALAGVGPARTTAVGQLHLSAAASPRQRGAAGR
jgi:hypothetical protein